MSCPPRFRYTYTWLDISGRNIAFTCNSLSNATEEQLFEVLGSPEIEPLARIDGKPLEVGLPTQLVKAAEWVDWIDEDDEDLRVLDFGESFFQGKEPKKLAQPGSLRVPETIFTDSFDHRVDLWRTGCMVRRHILVQSQNTNGGMSSSFMLSYSRLGHSGILARMTFSFSK